MWLTETAGRTCVWNQLDQHLLSFTPHVQKEHGVAVPKELAGLMLRFVQIPFFEISNLTHPSDKVIAPELAELAGVNLEEYSLASTQKLVPTWLKQINRKLIDIDAKTLN